MARLIKKAKQYGFTLVELLIVVAIIGVLSTIGIPSFRRMVQKSKKSEAKVNLGGLYTAEQAFFSEYGAFGNNITKIGFTVDGNPANLMYRVGFFSAANCTGQGAILPATAAATDVLGKAIQQAFPQYYAGFAAANTTAGNNVIAGQGCTINPALNTVWTAGGGQVNNVYSDPAGSDSNKFIAMAFGVIAPGVSKTAPAAAETDAWGVNEARLMSNIRDGVR